jgi:glucose-6-phosphate isomerase
MPGESDLLARFPSLDVAPKRAAVQTGFEISPGPLRSAMASHAASAERAMAGLRRRDPATWSDAAEVQTKIAHRLGWLTSPTVMAEWIERLEVFAESVRRDGVDDVVLLGMGGSSLAPEVLRAVVGIGRGWPRFHMLDSTDPAAVLAASTPPERTLYVLASKSGTTIEPNALAAHFMRRLAEASVPHPAGRFVAITDEGTPLAERARAEGFREIFLNPSDIGGRYSALSFFGMVPAALMGQDLTALIGWGVSALDAASSRTGDVSSSPPAALGLAIGAAALSGRDKLTLLLPTALQPLGLWVEQLIAESTGKEGTGVVPVLGEPLGDPATYGDDRFFVAVRAPYLSNSDELDAAVRGFKSANLPIATIELPDATALAAEFVRWEIATAVAGALLGINPFDEPNVQQAKDATRTLLDEFASRGSLPTPPPDRVLAAGATLTFSAAVRQQLTARRSETVLSLTRRGDYVSVLAYLGPDPRLAESLTRFRAVLRGSTSAATTLAYGPRYLHSTGQLHKGGPDSGVFVLITAAPREDVPIPGEKFSFGTLELAQALGDFASLDRAGRRALHLHLPSPDSRVLEQSLSALLG